METLELPVLEETEESTPQLDHVIDLTAFRLWREASSLDKSVEEDTPAAER